MVQSWHCTELALYRAGMLWIRHKTFLLPPQHSYYQTGILWIRLTTVLLLNWHSSISQLWSQHAIKRNIKVLAYKDRHTALALYGTGTLLIWRTTDWEYCVSGRHLVDSHVTYKYSRLIIQFLFGIVFMD